MPAHSPGEQVKGFAGTKAVGGENRKRMAQGEMDKDLDLVMDSTKAIRPGTPTGQVPLGSNNVFNREVQRSKRTNTMI